MFLVGIGGVANAIPNVRVVTGPTSWDQQVTTFGTSDYVVNADFGALGAIFYNVARGLCGCLQDVAPASAPAPQLAFDAFVTISAPGTSVSWPPNSVQEAFLYYSFSAQPQVYAYELMSGATVLRTDIINPCSISRKTACGGSCGTISDKQLIPRFFRSTADAAQAPTGGFGAGATETCGAPFRKPGPLTAEQIEFVWVTAGGVVCAARSVDGTFYKFSVSRGGAAGVNQRAPQQLRLGAATGFNFLQLDGASCTPPRCSADVEIVFAVDQRFSAADYLLVQTYMANFAANYYNDSNNRIRMGAFFQDGTRVGFETALNPIFGNLVRGVPRGNPAATLDFQAFVLSAINAFWPAARAPGSPPRYLLTIVGGADSSGQATFTSLNAARASKGIEAWALGVAVGSNQLSLLPQLSDNPPAAQYVHYNVLGTASLLSTQLLEQAPRMCPLSDLCGGSCTGGVCVCGVCTCPVCTSTGTDKCATIECQGTSKVRNAIKVKTYHNHCFMPSLVSAHQIFAHADVCLL